MERKYMFRRGEISPIIMTTSTLAVIVVLGLWYMSYASKANIDRVLEQRMMDTNTPLSGGMEKAPTGTQTDHQGGGSLQISPFQGYRGTVLAGNTSPLLDFVSSDYEDVLRSDKLIVLYFYATWCPICRAEFPKMQEAFQGLTTDSVIGFRVNYNDSQTDDAERALAREFGVAYQHTKVFLKQGERVLKSPETWTADRYRAEIAKFVQ